MRCGLGDHRAALGLGEAGAAELPEPASSHPNPHEEAFEFCVDLRMPNIRFILMSGKLGTFAWTSKNT